MKSFFLLEHILFSYSMFIRLLWRSFFKSTRTQARLTLRRFSIMLVFFPFLFVVQTAHWLAFIMDEVMFRGYKTIPIEQPVFVVGVPRSGTTFLHRFLSEDKNRFTTLTLWEMIFAPTITQRKMIFALSYLDSLLKSPMKRFLQWLERFVFSSLDDIHRISLTEPEEDYFLLTPIYACFLMILPFPFPEEFSYLAFFDDQTSEKDKQRIMSFYKSCLQRHLYVHGTDKILLSKNVSFSPMIQTLNQTFPDCKIIGTVRNPIFAVPSHISSMMEGAAIFDNDNQGNTFRNQMVDVQTYAYRQLAEVLPNIHEDRQITVKMEDLKSELYLTIEGIYERFGYRMDSEFEQQLRIHDLKQKSYQSKHHYDLKAYNLTEDDITYMFADVFERYNYPMPGVHEA